MPEDYKIRKATPEDEAAVTALLTAAYGALMRPAYEEKVLPAALPAMSRANPALLRSGRFYLAETPGGLAGCGGWSVEAPGSGEIKPGLAHVRHFGTHPSRARCGVGRAILTLCMEAARAEGVRKLECCASLNAEPFYASLGFQTVRPIEIPMGPGIRMPCLLMRREI